MTTNDVILKKWNTWFGTVYNDIVTVHYCRMIYRDVGSMVTANPAIQKPSSFYDVFGRSYVALVVMIVRRQCDDRGDSISLMRLLHDISLHPEVVSRQRFHQFYKGSLLSEAAIDADFETAGVGAGRDFMDPKMVEADVQALKSKTAIVHMYANKVIAHIDVQASATEVPTFGELDDSIDELARLCQKYSLLLSGGGILSLEPVIQYDWQAVFRVPWMVEPLGEHSQGRNPHVS